MARWMILCTPYPSAIFGEREPRWLKDPGGYSARVFGSEVEAKAHAEELNKGSFGKVAHYKAIDRG